MDNQLQHVGVLGMKWGVRRSRSSSDGSADHRQAKALRKKKLKDMDNKDIQALVSRQSLENQYKSLNPSAIAKGARIAKNALGVIGSITAGVATVTTAVSLGQKYYNLIKDRAG